MSNAETTFYVHPSSYVDEGVVLAKGCKIWHFCHLMGPSELGENCNLGQNVVVSPQVKLGRNVKVQNNVSIYTGVECEDDVFLGPSMVFTNVYNPRSAVSRKHEYRRTLVKEGATIGANATIVCGIEIGRFAFIGAGALVNRNVPDFALVVGNPGRQIGWMSRHGQRLHFGDQDKAQCPESGIWYQKTEAGVQEQNG
jgi:UDP-2-acetamido-3-amino-2,3-dideoxy-glucuronate N-acetyltransferase